MDFIAWWFDDHFILSTVFTPALSVAWCAYNEIVIRGIISVGIFLITKLILLSSIHSHN